MHLSAFIIHHMDGIITEWQDVAITLMPHAKTMPSAALHEHAQKILKAIVQDLDAAGIEASGARQAAEPAQTGGESAAAVHGALRYNAGFEPAQLTAEFRALRNNVLRLWMTSGTTPTNDTLAEVLRFNDAIDQALTEAVGRYTQEAERARNMFINVLSHDLRTPLGAIAITSQYLAMPNIPENKRLEATMRIDRCISTMNALIKDVLEYTRSRLGKSTTLACKPCDLTEVCHTVCDDIRTVHIDTELRCEVTGKLEGDFDPSRIHQALWNLLNSAVQQSDRQTPVVLTASASGQHIRIRVRAKGRPLPAQTLQSMFDPMAQFVDIHAQHDDVKPSLQLGLFVARQIIRAHQGEVSVDTDSNATAFEVTLLCHAPRPTPIHSHPARQPSAFPE